MSSGSINTLFPTRQATAASQTGAALCQTLQCGVFWLNESSHGFVSSLTGSLAEREWLCFVIVSSLISLSHPPKSWKMRALRRHGQKGIWVEFFFSWRKTPERIGKCQQGEKQMVKLHFLSTIHSKKLFLFENLWTSDLLRAEHVSQTPLGQQKTKQNKTKKNDAYDRFSHFTNTQYCISPPTGLHCFLNLNTPLIFYAQSILFLCGALERLRAKDLWNARSSLHHCPAAHKHTNTPFSLTLHSTRQNKFPPLLIIAVHRHPSSLEVLRGR